MAAVPLSFVDDLTSERDFWNLKCRIIRLWKQSFRWDLILLDERGKKVQAQVGGKLIPHFKNTPMREDDVIFLKKFGMAKQNDTHKVVDLPHKINFFRCTTVQPANTFEGHPYAFKFESFPDIVAGKLDKALTVDVIGRIAWAGNMDIFSSGTKETKRLHLDLQDLEGNVLRCTFWAGFAEQVNDFVVINNSPEMVILVIQHGRVKEWGGVKSVQNDMFATRLFINEELPEANDLRRRMIVHMGPTVSQTVLSSQTSYPLREEFLVNTPRKKVDEIIEIEQPSKCVVLATISMVEQEHGWFYKAHRKCGKKAYTKAEFLELAKSIPDNFIDEPMDSLWCLECLSIADSVLPKFKVQFRVQDNSGSVSFVMFDKDVAKILGLSATDIRERQLKANELDTFPQEVQMLQNKFIAFKIVIAPYNLHNSYHVYTVAKVCDDNEVIKELDSAEPSEPVTPQESDANAIRLDDCSQHGGDSKDALSGTGSSFVVDAKKNSATSPVVKRPIPFVVEGTEVGEGSAVRVVKKKLA